MLSLLAAAVLTSSEPSAAALAPRFVEVQAALPGEQPTYAGWTRQQLQQEIDRLEDERPGIGLQVTLIAVGAAVGVVDLLALMVGGLIALGGTRIDTTYTVALIGFAVGAIGLLVVGGIFLRAAIKDRAEYNKEIEKLKQAILDLAPAAPMGPPPPPLAPPPPGTQFPPQVQFTPPWFAVTLARF